MGGFKRSMAVKLGGSLTIKPLSDKQIFIKNVNGPKTKEKEITLNEEFDDEGADGTPARVNSHFIWLKNNFSDIG